MYLVWLASNKYLRDKKEIISALRHFWKSLAPVLGMKGVLTCHEVDAYTITGCTNK